MSAKKKNKKKQHKNVKLPEQKTNKTSNEKEMQTVQKNTNETNSKVTDKKKEIKLLENEKSEEIREESITNVDIQEIEKAVKEEKKAKKTIPEEEQKKMNGEVFKNIAIAIGVVVFLNFIILGFINIEPEVFIVDLKVFALSILAVAIGIFEYAYKKDSGKIALYGIETLVLSLCMLGFIYLDIMQNSKFVIITILTTYIIAIYYTVKSLIIYKRMKKQYLINSIKKEIVKK